jgi:DNA-binding beta-propeller fold protein YncE
MGKANMALAPRYVLAIVALAGCAANAETPPAPPPLPPAVPVAPPPPTAAAPIADPQAPDAAAASRAPEPTGPARLVGTAVPLPGVKPPASLDYIACDRRRGKVWVPVGNTGSVAVFDVAKQTFASVDGFKTGVVDARGRQRFLGPSAVSLSDDTAFVGDRFNSEVCAVDASTLKKGACAHLPSKTDGVAYVASTKEVWVTTPGDQSIVVLDASRADALKVRATIKLDGSPEGYAIDDTRGVFYTNLEDKNATVVIDLKTHAPKAKWNPGCGEDGPRGVATDVARGFVFVACTDHVVVLDGNHEGAALAKFDTGAGVDNIDWLDSHRLLYAAGGRDARLTIASFGDDGRPSVVATGTTATGARNPVADAAGHAYVADPANGGILVFPFTAP